MAIDPDKLFDTASALLTSLVTRLGDNGIDVPNRRYVHQGEVVIDGVPCCLEELVVSVGPLTHAMPGESPSWSPCAPPRAVQLDVWLTRCVPNLNERGNPPTSAKLTEAAARTLADMWVLAQSIWDGYQAEEWGSPCQSVLLGDVEPYGPEGACGGSHAQVFVQVF